MYEERPGFNQFFDNVKKEEIKDVLLLFGRESFLFRWAVDTLVSKYVNPALKAIDRVVIDESELEGKTLVDAVLEACETPSMLSDKKIVWVREPSFLQEGGKTLNQDEKNRLLDYLENPDEGAILIFSSQTINIKDQSLEYFLPWVSIYQMDRLDKKALRQFITKRFRAAKVSVLDRDIQLLIDESGYFNRESDYDLYSMENDLKKLIAIAEEGRLPENAIRDLIAGDDETYLFDLIESISTRKKERAFEILNNKITKGDEIKGPLSQLATQFELMISIKEMRDDGIPAKEMAKRLGANSYRVEKLVPQAGRFSKEEIMRILSSIYEIDREIKTGMMDGRLAMELFIANV